MPFFWEIVDFFLWHVLSSSANPPQTNEAEREKKKRGEMGIILFKKAEESNPPNPTHLTSSLVSGP